jgi:dipeptidyl aminopeptidase/acylaminoacyl peptidase
MVHRKHLALLLALLAAESGAQPAGEERSNLLLDGVPALDASLADFLPDGSMLIVTRFADVAQLHRVTQPLGSRTQLTFGHEPVVIARAAPGRGSDRFVFLRDRGGDEQAQLVLQRLADPKARLLTDGKSRHGGVVWSNDGKRIAYFGTGRDGVSHDIFVAEIDGASPPRLLVNGNRSTWTALDWSPDDRKLLLLNTISSRQRLLFVADAATGSLKAIDTDERRRGSSTPVAITAARFARDGRGVYLISDRDADYAQLRHVDLASGASRVLTSHIARDIEEFALSADGRFLAFIANEDGYARLQLLDLQASAELTPRGLPRGLYTNLRFHPDGRRLGLTIESSDQPRDVYVYDIERGELVRWTQSEPGPIDVARFTAAEQFRFATWDRSGKAPREIAALITRPKPPVVAPVIIRIDGAAGEQQRPGFDLLTQILVGEFGYAVIAPNVRGSSGYGKSFLALDDGALREDAVRDIGSLLVWIRLQRDLDPSRVAIMGRGYGGYLSLASLLRYGERLRGGIIVAGMSSFATFLERTSADQRDWWRAELGDERDAPVRSFLLRVSPLTSAVGISKPILIVQGLNDPRVPASQSEQLLWRLRAQQNEVWYLAARDEGHAFGRKGNRDATLRVVVNFLDRLRR